MEKVSIIIPVYNAEIYIGKCIESLEKQTYNNIEIVIVNDKSNDSSLEICKKKQLNDNRIKIYENPKNMGVSETRNLGIRKATGDYLMFVDADDYLNENAIEVLVKCIKEKKCEIVRFEYNTIINNELTEIDNDMYKSDRYLNKNDIIEGFINKLGFNTLWISIINMNFLKESKIFFNSDYICAEDMLFNMELFPKAKGIFYLHKRLYNYNVNDNSVTNTKDKNKICKKISDAINIYDMYYEFLKQYNKDDKANREKIAIKSLKMISYELENIVYVKCKKREKINIIKETMMNSLIKKHICNIQKEQLSRDIKYIINEQYFKYFLYIKLKRILKSRGIL